ncbi:uncharacterized protein [Nerophis lumbriciformis]|uniref:uncharacterized protein isoform X2 n=1 Tax=Nerophis lumbriciformis TaxID=546530 RepID=UPI003BA85749
MESPSDRTIAWNSGGISPVPQGTDVPNRGTPEEASPEGASPEEASAARAGEGTSRGSRKSNEGTSPKKAPAPVPHPEGRSGEARRPWAPLAPWMSGAQFGDPKELRPVALGEAPFGIRLYDSRPDGRPPVSEKMLNQTMKGLDFSACQIGSDRRCATRTGHGEPVGPDHSLEFRRHKSRLCRASVSSRVRLGATARAQPDRSVGCSSARTSVWTSGGSSPGEGSHSDLGVKGRILPDGATRD